MRRRKLDLTGVDDDTLVPVLIQVEAWILRRYNARARRLGVARRSCLREALVRYLTVEEAHE